MPSLQTKALVVTPISGDNFRIIPPNCMVGQQTACAIAYVTWKYRSCAQVDSI